MGHGRTLCCKVSVPHVAIDMTRPDLTRCQPIYIQVGKLGGRGEEGGWGTRPKEQVVGIKKREGMGQERTLEVPICCKVSLYASCRQRYLAQEPRGGLTGFSSAS